MEPTWAVQGCADMNSAFSAVRVACAVGAGRCRRSKLVTVRIRPKLAYISADQHRTGEVIFYAGTKGEGTGDDQEETGMDESEQAGEDKNESAVPSSGASTA